jgi:hypothetical protein
MESTSAGRGSLRGQGRGGTHPLLVGAGANSISEVDTMAAGRSDMGIDIVAACDRAKNWVTFKNGDAVLVGKLLQSDATGPED